MGRRTILLLAALVVAALGASAVFLYVQGVNERALAGQEPTQVLVATEQVPAGMTGAAAERAGAFELQTVAAASVARTALSDTSEIRDLVALSPIFPGEQVLSAKFGRGGATAALPLPKGKLAVSVQLSDPARVAGFVGPGTQVAVFLTSPVSPADAAADAKPSGPAVPPPTAAATGPGSTAAPAQAAGTAETTTAGSEEEAFTTATLLPRATTVAAGQSTLVTQTTTTADGAQTTEEIPRAILTLALTENEAQKVVWGQRNGELYFTLLTKNSRTQKGTYVDAENLFR